MVTSSSLWSHGRMGVMNVRGMVFVVPDAVVVVVVVGFVPMFSGMTI